MRAATLHHHAPLFPPALVLHGLRRTAIWTGFLTDGRRHPTTRPELCTQQPGISGSPAKRTKHRCLLCAGERGAPRERDEPMSCTPASSLKPHGRGVGITRGCILPYLHFLSAPQGHAGKDGHMPQAQASGVPCCELPVSQR
jgi:hypothetical protein